MTFVTFLAQLLPLNRRQKYLMKKIKQNQFVFRGEIAELLTTPSNIEARVTCKPGTIIIDVPSIEDYQLGDEVIISGSFICEKIENIINFNTNH